MNKDLTKGNVRTVLLSFIIPLLGSMLFQQLYNITDSLVAGKLISSSALAAVGNSYEITLIFISFATGISMGCSVVVSQLFGAGRKSDVKCAVSTTFILTLVVSITLLVLGLIFAEPLLKVIKTPEDLVNPSLQYLEIYILGVPFLFLYNTSTGIFSALGDSKTPFVFLAISSILNIIVDIVFVACFDMGIRGVALATFLCQGLSSIVSLVVVIKRLKNIDTSEFKLFSLPILKKILIIAIPSTCQQLFVSVGNILIQTVINSFGAVVMAAYAAAIKLNNMVITALMTLGNGVSSFTAQNIGALLSERVKKGYREGLLIAFTFILPIALIFLIFGKYLLLMFIAAKDINIIEAGRSFQVIVSWFYPVVAIKIITDGCLRGMGRMGAFMTSTFADLIIRVVLSFILSISFGYIGIWYSWPIGWVIGMAFSVLFYIKADKGKSII
ncbi:MAG: MATE family efflux transporter [Spirochaetales bacterium]|nr:MATE family efflux transporter [Spirochaetales bacterium]